METENWKNYRNMDPNLDNLNNDGTLFKEGKIEFIGVSCQYPNSNKEVIRNLNFVIQPGEKIGIIGQSGAGKSSLLKLLLRILEPKTGQIMIDGHNILEMDLKDLRKQMSIVSQDPSIFEGTLRDNIDPEYFFLSQEEKQSIESKDKADKINRILNDLGFKNKDYLLKGLEMEINGEIQSLSGGEQQIIILARELLNPKKIVIFDEATCNLDEEIEELYLNKMETVFKDSTIIVVAHRLNNVKNCDRVMVIEQGEIIKFDKPSTLIN